jgi:hypothetical protein
MDRLIDEETNREIDRYRQINRYVDKENDRKIDR